MCKALCAACLQQSITVLGSAGWNLEVLYQNSPCWCWKASVQSLVVFGAKFCSEQWSSGGCSSSLPPCWEPCVQGDAEWYICGGDGNGEWGPLLCLSRAPQKSDTVVWKLMFQKSTPFKALFIELPPPFLRILNWMIFYHKLLCPCNGRIFLLGRNPPRMWSLFDIKVQCSNFAFSMGHCFLPRCNETLPLQEAGCPHHGHFVPALVAVIVWSICRIL